MKILPPRTSPPESRIERRHQPESAAGRFGYRAFRSCLRWEFGFTCAFCLLHEADLAEHGVEGLGLMSIEHLTPASVDEELINRYDNCFYVCRLCNGSRAVAPRVDRQGRRLLDPCQEIWSKHFFLSNDDRLVPYVGDPDAKYTAEVYDLDDPRKVVTRRSRRERLEEWTALLGSGPGLLEALVARAEKTQDPERQQELMLAARELRRSLLRAFRDIRRYAAIPKDADQVCGCARPDCCSLPDALESQTLEMAFPEE